MRRSYICVYSITTYNIYTEYSKTHLESQTVSAANSDNRNDQ